MCNIVNYLYYNHTNYISNFIIVNINKRYSKITGRKNVNVNRKTINCSTTVAKAVNIT